MIDALAVLRELVAIDSTSAKSNLPMLDALERRMQSLAGTIREARHLAD